MFEPEVAADALAVTELDSGAAVGVETAGLSLGLIVTSFVLTTPDAAGVVIAGPANAKGGMTDETAFVVGVVWFVAMYGAVTTGLDAGVVPATSACDSGVGVSFTLARRSCCGVSPTRTRAFFASRAALIAALRSALVGRGLAGALFTGGVATVGACTPK